MKLKSIRIDLRKLMLSAVFLASCVRFSPAQITNASQASKGSESSVASSQVTYDEDDLRVDWKNRNPTYIELSGTSAHVKGSGVEVNGAKIVIMTGCVYVVSGTSANGQIIVDVENKGTVQLVLNGMQIHGVNSAPIYVKNAGKTIITLQEGAENLITDGKTYVFSDPATEEPNAAIFSKDYLTINGTGSLTVRAAYNNGITSKDDLLIIGGPLLSMRSTTG